MGAHRTRRSPGSLRDSLAISRTIDESVLALVSAGLEREDFQMVIDYPTLREKLVNFWKRSGYSDFLTVRQAKEIMGDRMITIDELRTTRGTSMFHGRVDYDRRLLESIPFREEDLLDLVFLLPVVEFSDDLGFSPYHFTGDADWQDIIYCCTKDNQRQTSWWTLLRNRTGMRTLDIPENERLTTVYEYLQFCFATGKISKISRASVLCKKVMRESEDNPYFLVEIDSQEKTIKLTKNPLLSKVPEMYTVLKPRLME